MKKTNLTTRRSQSSATADRKRSLAAKRGAVTRARNRALAEKRQLRLHHKLIATGAIAVVLVLAFIGIRNQLQTFAATTATHSFVGLAGKCLDNADSITANKNHIQLWRCNGTNAQKWTVTSAGAIVSGNGNQTYCLDIPGANRAEFTYLQLYRCNGTIAQKFHLSGNTIISTLTGYCATVKGAAPTSGTRIWMQKCYGTASQKWAYGTALQAVGNPVNPSVPDTTSGSSSSPTPGKLIFDDEFNGAANTAPDANKWEVMGGTQPSRWGVECFVNDRAHIAQDGKGDLALTATSNSSVPCQNGSGKYESGGMTTGAVNGGTFSYKYGTAEASIKVPCGSGSGLWPAWWADGPDWPKGGEIDFLEVMTNPPAGYNVTQTIHGPKGTGAWQLPTWKVSSAPLCNAFHTYGAIWTQGKIQFTFDGNVTKTFTASDVPSGGSWPFDSNSERLLLDLQVGSWGGSPQSSEFPATMLVDYVRVYAS